MGRMPLSSKQRDWPRMLQCQIFADLLSS